MHINLTWQSFMHLVPPNHLRPVYFCCATVSGLRRETLIHPTLLRAFSLGITNAKIIYCEIPSPPFLYRCSCFVSVEIRALLRRTVTGRDFGACGEAEGSPLVSKRPPCSDARPPPGSSFSLSVSCCKTTRERPPSPAAACRPTC